MGPLPILLFVKCLLDIQFTIAFDVLETKWRKNAVMDSATKTDKRFSSTKCRHCLCCVLTKAEAPGLLDKRTMLGYNVRLQQGADSAPWLTRAGLICYRS